MSSASPMLGADRPGPVGGRPPDWMLDRLPERWQDDALLMRFVLIFQQIADGLLAEADQLEDDFDPAVAPSAMVTLLAEWIGLDFIDPSLDDELRRRIVRELTWLTGWSGTRRSIVRFLELITGAPVEVDDTGGVFPAGEMTVTAPHVEIRVEATGWLTARQLFDIVRRELPASLTCSLYVAGELVDPTPPAGWSAPAR